MIGPDLTLAIQIRFWGLVCYAIYEVACGRLILHELSANRSPACRILWSLLVF